MLFTGAAPTSAFDWFFRALLGFLAVLIGRACWRRRIAREAQQKGQEAARIADRTRQLAIEKERAEEGNRFKARFLSSIGEDIRVPLNEILNSLELVLMTGLTGEQRNLLERSKSSARQVLTQLAGVLDISIVEAEKLRINRVEFSVRDWFRGVITTLAASAKEQGVEFQTNIAGDFPNQLVGDPDLLRRVLRMLVNHAVESSCSHQINLVLRLDRRARKSFQADGQTVPIFFSVETRVQAARESIETAVSSDKGEAVLPFCERVLGLMGGRVWVQEEDARRKLCCTIRLDVPRPALALPSETAPGVETLKPKLRALLVESNRANQLALLPVLEKQGLHCLVANDGIEAIALLDRFTPDLIVLATQTSAPDELEASRLVREREKHTGSHTPILVLTAQATRADREACLQAGADGCLSKSALPSRLRDAIETLRAAGATS